MKHTPGPWEVNKQGHIQYPVNDATGFQIWKPSNQYWPNADGDRHLIAAAPDLLAACEAALDRLVNEVGDCSCERVWIDDDYIHQCAQCDLRAAISKARGGEQHGRSEAAARSTAA